jgi:hypothetical protein
MKASKLLILLFLALFSPKILRGQEQVDSSYKSAKMMVKFNLFAFINFVEPTLAASFEHRLFGKHYLEHEIGYIHAKPLDLPEGTHGFSYRLGYHYVYHEDNFKRQYAGVQFHFREFSGEVENFIWRKNFNYQQNIKYQNRLYSYGFTALLGMTSFFRKSSRWFTDYQFGIGMSWKPLSIENYPSDAERPKFNSRIYNSSFYINDGNTLRNGENPIYMNVLLALKIGYIIR